MLPNVRINGFGIGFAGVSKPDGEGNCTATQWFQVLFLPIFPIARFKIQPLRKVPFRFDFKTLSRENLVVKEILITYLYGWILFPLLVFGPFLFFFIAGTPEVRAAYFLPSWTAVPFFLLALTWLCVSVWKLRTWDYERWFKKT